MNRRSLIIYGLSLILMVSTLSVPALSQQKDFSELEKTVLDELASSKIPGAAIVIVSGDRVVFSKGFGVSNAETGTPVTPDMLFRLGSTTKMFTAAALVSLSEEGKLDMNQPIANFTKGLDPKIARVSAHQLLSHTAGIIDNAPMYGLHDDSALREEVRSWKEDRFFTEPGKVISYSNPGYWLAGYVIEEASGKSYADQLSESLFKPLGMSRTTLRPTMAMTYPLAQGHNTNREGKFEVIRPMADNSASWPAGSIFSSALDLSRFVIAFLGGGKVDGKQVLSPAVIAKLSTPQTAVPGSDNKYAYGLMITNYRGVRIVEHGGARSGYGSTIRMSPDHRFGVIILANRSGASLNRSAEKAMELMLPLNASKDEPQKELPMNESEMTRYAGVYAQGQTRYELLVKDGKLYGKQGSAEGEIRKTGENRFEIKMPNGSQQFALVPGSDGKTEYLHISLRSAKRQ